MRLASCATTIALVPLTSMLVATVARNAWATLITQIGLLLSVRLFCTHVKLPRGNHHQFLLSRQSGGRRAFVKLPNLSMTSSAAVQVNPGGRHTTSGASTQGTAV